MNKLIDTSDLKSSISPYTEEFKAQYIYDTYGRFPATVQSVFFFFVSTGPPSRLGLLRSLLQTWGVSDYLQEIYEKMALNHRL
jgi:hypothetical protein